MIILPCDSAFKASFYIPENRPNFLTARGFRMSNSRLVVEDDDKGKFRLERVNVM